MVMWDRNSRGKKFRASSQRRAFFLKRRQNNVFGAYAEYAFLPRLHLSFRVQNSNRPLTTSAVCKMAPQSPSAVSVPDHKASKKPQSSTNTTKPPPGAAPIIIPPIVAFYAFALAHILAAAYSPIQDCDEVFNYWEPTHYLTHGYGLQTWEYSPEFSIRSWAYVALHAFAGRLSSIFPFTSKARYP
jgi:hypothetical protein